MQTRVIKVGGSLFDEDRLKEKLRAWLAAQSEAHQVLIAGGGSFIDTIRAWDRSWRLPPRETHWLCIEHLDLTARALSLLLPEWIRVERFEDLRMRLQAATPQRISYSCLEFLKDWDRQIPGGSLPETWETTSDSIAARLAVALGAAELVLVKSADPPRPLTLHHAAHSGYVDAVFPKVASGLARVRCVHLRSGRETILVRGTIDDHDSSS
jgi:5-(aminomethyl)-3-furanmethanol phosphate kinase